MNYPLFSALVFLNIVIAINAMEKDPRNANDSRRDKMIKVRSNSSPLPVPRLTQNNMSLETLEQPGVETPHKRPSPNTDKKLEEYDKKNALPSPRPGSPKSSPRLSSPRVMSPRTMIRSLTTNTYPEDVLTKALSNSKIILAAKENK